jgi:hypothetical protein
MDTLLSKIKAKPNGVLLVAEIMTWIVPTLVVPAVRFLQEDKDIRHRLFVRDISTYGVGACCYFLGKLLSLKILQPRIADATLRTLISMGLGVTVNMAFAGFGSVRLSKRVARRDVSKQAAMAHPSGQPMNRVSPIPPTVPLSLSRATGPYRVFNGIY